MTYAHVFFFSLFLSFTRHCTPTPTAQTTPPSQAQACHLIHDPQQARHQHQHQRQHSSANSSSYLVPQSFCPTSDVRAPSPAAHFFSAHIAYRISHIAYCISHIGTIIQKARKARTRKPVQGSPPPPPGKNPIRRLKKPAACTAQTSNSTNHGPTRSGKKEKKRKTPQASMGAEGFVLIVSRHTYMFFTPW